jgi:XTP/dITP diphosphohydrolase
VAVTSEAPIAFVTSNAGKLTTASRHLRPFGIHLEQVPLDLDEIQSDSVQDVALHKARQAFDTIGRPLLIDDSGFYIDELNGFPGPLVRHVVDALGAEGVARIADRTSTRRCHFEGALVYVDAAGEPRAFHDQGATGTLADAPAPDPDPDAWSPLWSVFITPGATRPLSALTHSDRARVLEAWATDSCFARFGHWYTNRPAAPGAGHLTSPSSGVSGCLPCSVLNGERPLPGGQIWGDRNWFVDHCFGPLGLGTLVMFPVRHVLHVADLTAEEIAPLGAIVRAAAQVATELVDPDQVYVSLWSHADGRPGHIHFVIQPVSAETMNRFGSRFGPALQAEMFSTGLPEPDHAIEAVAAARRRFEDLRGPATWHGVFCSPDGQVRHTESTDTGATGRGSERR